MMKIQVFKGVDGVSFGDRREDVAKRHGKRRFGKRYSELDKNMYGTNAVGVIGRLTFIYFDSKDCVEFIQVVQPQKLVDKSGHSIPLQYSLFIEWASGHDTKNECGIMYIPTLLLAIHFSMNDDGIISNDEPAYLCSIGMTNSNTTQYFSPFNEW